MISMIESGFIHQLNNKYPKANQEFKIAVEAATIYRLPKAFSHKPF